MSYCEYVSGLDQSDLHRIYHDKDYGFPLESDNELFGRLILEINQAGLSWLTILKKQDGFRKAYAGYSIEKIARFVEKDRNRLLSDASIIRNRLKIDAAISNAKTILQLQEDFGSFKGWLDHHHPLSRDEWTKLFRKIFRFTGGEIVNEFLVSTGYLAGSHVESCPVYQNWVSSKPRCLVY